MFCPVYFELDNHQIAKIKKKVANWLAREGIFLLDSWDVVEGYLISTCVVYLGVQA